MSDCQSWFGAARSKRRGGCSRAPVGSGASTSSPSSWRILRTSVSDTPRASKRASRSLIRRVPCSGCSCLAATTASRFASVAAVRLRDCSGGGVGTSASTPPFSYSASHFWIVATLGPRVRDTRSTDALPSSTASTTRSRNASGYARPRVSAVTPVPRCPPLPLLRLPICLSPFRPPCPARKGDGARRFRSASGAHQVARGTPVTATVLTKTTAVFALPRAAANRVS